MVCAIPKLSCSKSGHAGNLLFNIIHNVIHNIENVHVAKSVYFFSSTSQQAISMS